MPIYFLEDTIMKKKIFAIVLVLCLSFTALSAAGIDLSGDVGIGYMNYTIITEYKRSALAEDLEAGLSGHLGTGTLVMDNPKATDIYNALNVGLSLKYNYLYTNICVAFPFTQIPTGDNPLGKKINGTNNIKGSVIFDGQLGAGVTLLKNTPLNIFVGGAIGINYIRTKRALPSTFVNTVYPLASSLKEIRSKTMLGVGIDVGIKYYFTKNVGIGLDLKETIYFVPLSTKRYYKGTLKDGTKFTYYITKKKNKNINKLIKYSWANNFSMRLGVTFKL